MVGAPRLISQRSTTRSKAPYRQRGPTSSTFCTLTGALELCTCACTAHTHAHTHPHMHTYKHTRGLCMMCSHAPRELRRPYIPGSPVARYPRSEIYRAVFGVVSVSCRVMSCHKLNAQLLFLCYCLRPFWEGCWPQPCSPAAWSYNGYSPASMANMTGVLGESWTQGSLVDAVNTLLANTNIPRASVLLIQDVPNCGPSPSLCTVVQCCRTFVVLCGQCPRCPVFSAVGRAVARSSFGLRCPKPQVFCCQWSTGPLPSLSLTLSLVPSLASSRDFRRCVRQRRPLLHWRSVLRCIRVVHVPLQPAAHPNLECVELGGWGITGQQLLRRHVE
jgi:hypothetical protein